MQVVLTGWRYGLHKIKLTQYLCLHTTWDLARSLQATDDLLFGRRVIVEFPVGSNPFDVKIDLLEIGAYSEMLNPNP
jgi:hypothetical protein